MFPNSISFMDEGNIATEHSTATGEEQGSLLHSICSHGAASYLPGRLSSEKQNIINNQALYVRVLSLCLYDWQMKIFPDPLKSSSICEHLKFLTRVRQKLTYQ